MNKPPNMGSSAVGKPTYFGRNRGENNPPNMDGTSDEEGITKL